MNADIPVTRARIYNIKGVDSNNPIDLNVVHDDGDGDNQTKKNLATDEFFDSDGFNKRDWNIVRNIFDKNIEVIFTDGMRIKGSEENINFLIQCLEFAPDSKIIHQIQFGSGEFTCVNSVIVGTFTHPLTSIDGSIIQPNGNKFVVNQCKINQWKNNKLVRSLVFTDNGDTLKQLGINKL